MDTNRFDAVARFAAARRTRRATLGGAGLGLAAVSVPLAARVAAQEATPAAEVRTFDPNDPHPSADAPAKTEFLFVQAFAGGTWAPKAGEDGVYTLTLSGASAQTVYFSDRPERIFGSVPTQTLLDGLGFTPANPPNAALVAPREGSDDQDVLLIELFNPTLDEAAGSLTYEARVLADYVGDGLAHAARQQTDYTLPETFAEGGLFIDDCPNGDGYCYQIVNGEKVKIGGKISVPTCTHVSPDLNCQFCGDPICQICGNGTDAHYGKVCHEKYPSQCSYNSNGIQGWDCFVDWEGTWF